MRRGRDNMLRNRIDLPLTSDPATRLLPWIISVMVFLAMLMLAGALVLTGATASWEKGLSGRYTVQIPPIEGETGDEATRRVERAIQVLTRTAGVAGAKQVPIAEVAASLEPWLGAGTSVLDLPLPYLIDVTIAKEPQVNLKQLRQQLTLAVADASLDDHGVWRRQIADLILALQLLAAGVIALIAGCAVAAVVFATRSGIAVHHDVIMVLHLIGATDRYIARQFQRHAFRLALKGGIAGAVLAAATLSVFVWGVVEFDPMLMPDLRFTPWHWGAIFAVPVVACFIAMRTARATVLRALGQMQ
ncbi:MAG: hypothetical protein CMM48_15695 [Rhodospirillaceae bacterium]|nr:hypothetical protein [Rhodospirillaceae bacterium]